MVFLQSHLEATSRFLSKLNKKYKFEVLVLKFIQSLMKAQEKSGLTQILHKFKTEFETLYSDPFEQNAFEYFDCISWIEGKLGQENFADIVKGKINATVAGLNA